MKKTNILFALFASLSLFSTLLYADHSGHDEHKHHDSSAMESVMVHDAFVRATPPGATNSAAYFTLISATDKDVMVTSAQANVSNIAELHSHSMVDGAMSMRQVRSVHVPAKKKVMFQPGGLHLMLFELKKPLIAGEKVHLTLNLNNGETVKFMADIVSPTDLKIHDMPKKGMREGDDVKANHSHH